MALADQDAVSSTIGVILLLSITVVMAVMVFMMVQSNNKDIPDPPKIAFLADYSGVGGVLTVSAVGADAGEAEWDRVSIGTTSTATCTLPTGSISAGDEVVCSTEGHLSLAYSIGSGETVLLWNGEIR